MNDRALTNVRPWPIDPRDAPLNPSERTTGPAYAPPAVEPPCLFCRVLRALLLVGGAAMLAGAVSLARYYIH